MNHSAAVVACLLVASALAGCAGTDDATIAGPVGSAGKSSGPSAGPSAPPATVTPDLGGIEGLVADEEVVPIPGVRIAILQHAAEATTDNDGRFSFSGLEPGQYSLVADRLGYESSGRKVTVVAGEVATVTITLKALAISEAFSETLRFDGYIQAGEAFVDIITNSFGQGIIGCTKCEWPFNASATVEEFFFEIDFKPTVPNPTGRTLLSFQIWDEGTDKNYATESWTSRENFSLVKETAKWPDKGQKFYILNYCEALWVCVDQRFTEYQSKFYYGLRNEGFTALPPA